MPRGDRILGRTNAVGDGMDDDMVVQRRAQRRTLLAGAALMSMGPAVAFANDATATRTSAREAPSEVVELRQYTIRGGRRDRFIDLFATTFVAPQEALGIRVLGWFRDLDDPDRFVWIRGFESMTRRAAGLAAFYGGDVWKAHRDEANAMIVDSDNVLLLQPLPGSQGLDAGAFRPSKSAAPTLVAAIHYLAPKGSAEFMDFFEAHMAARIELDGGRLVARLRSSDEPNNFPRLPVRTDGSVFVWIAAFQDDRGRLAFERRCASDTGWRDGASDAVLPALMRKPEMLRLQA